MNAGTFRLIEKLQNIRHGVTGALMTLAVAGFFAAVQPARADDPEFLSVGAGAFDISGDNSAALLSMEYTDKRKWLWALKPMTGFFVNHHGGLSGYAGLALDLYWGRRFVLTPSFAPGIYLKGGSADLGYPLEFRSSIKAAYRFDDRSRLGLDISHISNAGLDDRNPGANQLMLFYSIPFTKD